MVLFTQAFLQMSKEDYWNTTTLSNQQSILGLDDQFDWSGPKR